MLARIWVFVSGLPVGGAIALATLRDPTPLDLVWGALATGALLALLVTLLARRGDDEFERGRHLAAAASLGWAAVPAAVAIFFDWSPGPWVYVGLVVATLAGAFFSASRGLGPAGGLLRWQLRAASACVVASAGVLALAATGAAFFAREPEPNPRFAAALYSIDAAVVTRPLPVCSGQVESVTTLLEQGANPSLSPDGGQLWFDAAVPADGGRRQIHRLDRATGAVTCTTCGQLGNNVHPSLSPAGTALVFASDRHATWRRPDDTDLYLAAAQQGSKTDPGRRLTFTAGPDESPVFGPGPTMITWSRREAGRYEVVAAGDPFRPRRTAAEHTGSCSRAAARSGSPRSHGVPMHGHCWSCAAIRTRRSPSSGSTRALTTRDGLGDAAAPAGSFDADGGWLAFATARPLHWAGVLPRALGFALGPIANAQRAHASLRRDSGVRSGATAQAAESVALDLPAEVAAWGEPTGVALEPDGSGFVIGQRQSGPDGAHDRLVAVRLACSADGGRTARARRAVRAGSAIVVAALLVAGSARAGEVPADAVLADLPFLAVEGDPNQVRIDLGVPGARPLPTAAGHRYARFLRDSARRARARHQPAARQADALPARDAPRSRRGRSQSTPGAATPHRTPAANGRWSVRASSRTSWSSSTSHAAACASWIRRATRCPSAPTPATKPCCRSGSTTTARSSKSR